MHYGRQNGIYSFYCDLELELSQEGKVELLEPISLKKEFKFKAKHPNIIPDLEKYGILCYFVKSDAELLVQFKLHDRVVFLKIESTEYYHWWRVDCPILKRSARGLQTGNTAKSIRTDRIVKIHLERKYR